MTRDEYKRAGDLFEQIRELPSGLQTAALDDACGTDAALRDQVMRLLDADRNAAEEEFLNLPVLEEAAGLIVAGPLRLPASGMVLGNYRVGRPVGSGGMGVVFEAEDLRLSRRVAIKILPSSYLAERIQRFQREARAAAQLNHPHIAAIFDAGFDQGFHYIAMEFVEGRTLREMIAARAHDVDAKTVSDVMSQAASALSAAHEAGIVHRDIKPENIMVRPDGFVKVLDFGLALVREPASEDGSDLRTRPGHLAGTVQYLSPEQVLGKAAGPRSDLFSLGVVAYELATGVRPFDGPTDGAIFDAIVHSEPAPPSLVRPSLGNELDDFIQHALEKDPELRYQTAGDFRSSCLRLMRHSTPFEGTAKPVVRQRNRHRLVLAIVASTILPATAGTVWWMTRGAPVPHVTQVVQITRSQTPVTYFVDDGARLYFTAGQLDANMKAFQVGADGGEPLPMPQLDGMSPMDVSPDRSKLLLAQATGKNGYGHRPFWIAPTFGGAPRRLADLEGQFARWSPRGDRIMFSQGGSLKIASVDGSDAHDIAHVNGYIEDGAWSPNGDRMRFSVSLPNSRRIWEVRPDGSGLRAVSFPRWTEPWAETGHWTLDGKYYLFSAGQTSHDLWMVRDNGVGSPFRLTNGPLWDVRPQPSADGRRVYFIGASNFGQLIRFDAQARQWIPFLDGMDAAQVAYSRDAKWIAYADSKGSLWRSAADGSQRLQLTAPPLFARNPRWSPDGNGIVFHAGRVGEPDCIYIAAADGRSVIQLTHWEKGRGEGDGNWSPDGTAILYCAQSNEADRKPYLYTIDVNSRQIEQLPNTARLWSPRWSPNGKFLVALDENTHLRLYDMATHHSVVLTTFPTGFPEWSRDGGSVYFENDSSTGWYRVSVAQRKVELVQTLPALETALNSAGWVGMTPEGTVISARAVNSSNLYALEFGTK